MEAGAAIAEILKREGVEIIFGYPVNHLLEYAARAGIRPIIVRQERIGLHMADALSRLTSGEKIGVFMMQHGPGAENAYGGVAQAYGEAVPILVMPMGYPREIAHVQPNFCSFISMKGITKSSEPVTLGGQYPEHHAARLHAAAQRPWRAGAGRDAGRRVHRGGGGAARLPAERTAALRPRSRRRAQGRQAPRRGQAPGDLCRPGRALRARLGRTCPPVQLLAAPVTTSLGGKSAFPENHPLSLGSGGNAIPATVDHFLKQADLIFGIGCSFTKTNFGVDMPPGKPIIHATLDPLDVNKNVASELALIGDARLTLDALLPAVEAELGGATRDPAPVAREIAEVREPWLAKWMPKLTSAETPINPYRVIWDLTHTVDLDNTIITHDAGSPRDQISPFWKATKPLSYIGWGKTTQLGYGLGLAMGAKLACPDKLCINLWGDAAIGFTGMDFETAVRERIPILSILLNNFSMAIELKIMPVSTERYRSTDISGDYAAMARAFGGYGERITDPADIIPAIQRGIEQTRQGKPALLEFITSKEVEVSKFK